MSTTSRQPRPAHCHRTDSPFGLKVRNELVRDWLVLADARPDLDRQRNLAENLGHSDETLSEFARSRHHGRASTLVEDEVDRAAAIDVCRFEKTDQSDKIWRAISEPCRRLTDKVDITMLDDVLSDGNECLWPAAADLHTERLFRRMSSHQTPLVSIAWKRVRL